MPSTPGTVSKILWHFTGGPLWDKATNKQGAKLKSTEDACKALMGILKDKTLRLGGYKEVVKVNVRRVKTFDPATKQVVTNFNVPRTLQSAPVCCLADIPIQHLNYHAERYGKVAIGFHRSAAVRAGFSPVLYQVHTCSVLQDIYNGLSALEGVDLASIEDAASTVGDEISGLQCEEGHTVVTDGLSAVYDLEGHANVVTEAIQSANDSFQTLLCFIKTFDESDFGTIYCEREWRSTKQFEFGYDDISMIVVPKNTDDGEHYGRFVEEARSSRVPLTVSLIAWDDFGGALRRERMWYHVSRKKWDRDYIDDLRAPAEDRSPGESREPRFSVAPTLCQALLGVPEYQGALPTLNIYTVDVDVPERADVGDATFTGECCITQPILDRYNHHMSVHYHGYTVWTSAMRVCIVHAITTGRMTQAANVERAMLWNIADGVWTAKFNEPGDIEDLLAGKEVTPAVITPLPRRTGTQFISE